MQPNKRLRFGYIDIEVNEHGWRDRSYPQRVGPDTYRLMVVGDSVTFGYGAELAKTYTSDWKTDSTRLEEMQSGGGSKLWRSQVAGAPRMTR